MFSRSTWIQMRFSHTCEVNITSFYTHVMWLITSCPHAATLNPSCAIYSRSPWWIMVIVIPEVLMEPSETSRHCDVLLWVTCDVSCMIMSHLWFVMYDCESFVTCHVILRVICDLSCIIVTIHVLWFTHFTAYDNQVCMAKYITIVFCCD